MTDLLKEMCRISGKLHDLINETKNEKEKQKLLEIFFKVNRQCEKISQQVFDENDDFFKRTIDQIKDTDLVFKEFKSNQIKMINVFVHLIDIIANVEKIMLGWKITYAKYQKIE